MALCRILARTVEAIAIIVELDLASKPVVV